MPNALEFPRMLRAVVPLMRARHAVVNEFVALTHRHSLRICGRAAAGRAPAFAAVIGTLDDLSEPCAGLRRVNPIWVNRRAFHAINLPAGKVWSVHLPIFALPV